MFGNIKEVEAKLKEAKENLGNITVEGDAGAGLVKATANGKKQLIKVEIDKSLLNDGDLDMLNDLIVAAANKALSNAEELANEELKKSTQGILPNIPGMNFGG